MQAARLPDERRTYFPRRFSQSRKEPINQAVAGKEGRVRDHVTLAAASAKLRKRRPTPTTAVEALMYSLRRGIIELTQPDTLRRLSMFDEGQLKAICRRLQNFKPEIATPWSSEEVAALIARWRELHG